MLQRAAFEPVSTLQTKYSCRRRWCFRICLSWVPDPSEHLLVVNDYFSSVHHSLIRHFPDVLDNGLHHYHGPKKKSISMQGKIALAAHEQNCWFHQTQAADTKRDLILRCRLSISNRFVMSIGYFFRQSSRQKLFSDMYCCEL